MNKIKLLLRYSVKRDRAFLMLMSALGTNNKQQGENSLRPESEHTHVLTRSQLTAELVSRRHTLTKTSHFINFNSVMRH